MVVIEAAPWNDVPYRVNRPIVLSAKAPELMVQVGALGFTTAKEKPGFALVTP